MRFGVYFLSIYSKEKNTTQDQKAVGAGDAWTWVGIDADSKLVVSWFVGSRDADSANIFMNDVATRLKNRVQLTTDGSALINDYRNIFKLIQFNRNLYPFPSLIIIPSTFRASNVKNAGI